MRDLAAIAGLLVMLGAGIASAQVAPENIDVRLPGWAVGAFIALFVAMATVLWFTVRSLISQGVGAINAKMEAGFAAIGRTQDDHGREIISLRQRNHELANAVTRTDAKLEVHLEQGH